MCFTVRKISKLFFILCSAFVRLCELLKGVEAKTNLMQSKYAEGLTTPRMSTSSNAVGS